MLVPVQVWMEKRGLPPTLGAAVTVLLFLCVLAGTIYAILSPALVWVSQLPERIRTIQSNLAPLFEMFAWLERTIDRLASTIGVPTIESDQPTLIQAPTSVAQLVTQTAPSAAVQGIFAGFILFFFLSTYSGMRESMIRRTATFGGGRRAAYILRDMAQGTGAYIGMVAFINLTLGCAVTLAFWWLEIEAPVMWGGLAALLNFMPYIGPVAFFALTVIGGMASYSDALAALTPALAYVALNIAEAYVVTPWLLGRKFTINPLAIMISVSFWGWVWGTIGALISVPILIIGKVMVERIGGPNILGFFLDDTVLVSDHEENGKSGSTSLDSAAPPA